MPNYEQKSRHTEQTKQYYHLLATYLQYMATRAACRLNRLPYLTSGFALEMINAKPCSKIYIYFTDILHLHAKCTANIEVPN
jgi:hypothetical protein